MCDYFHTDCTPEGDPDYKEYCTWSNSEGSEYDDCDTQWETSCSGTFILNDGTPESNELKYCCYCGKPIEQLVEE